MNERWPPRRCPTSHRTGQNRHRRCRFRRYGGGGGHGLGPTTVRSRGLLGSRGNNSHRLATQTTGRHTHCLAAHVEDHLRGSPRHRSPRLAIGAAEHPVVHQHCALSYSEVRAQLPQQLTSQNIKRQTPSSRHAHGLCLRRLRRTGGRRPPWRRSRRSGGRDSTDGRRRRQGGRCQQGAPIAKQGDTQEVQPEEAHALAPPDSTHQPRPGPMQLNPPPWPQPPHTLPRDPSASCTDIVRGTMDTEGGARYLPHNLPRCFRPSFPHTGRGLRLRGREGSPT